MSKKETTRRKTNKESKFCPTPRYDRRFNIEIKNSGEKNLKATSNAITEININKAEKYNNFKKLFFKTCHLMILFTFYYKIGKSAMLLSSVLKFRTRFERDAAIALDKAVTGVRANSMGSMNNVKSGVERASWYSSCLFDKYENVCSELKNEDARVIKSVFEIYKRRNIIADIIRMYIEEELKK